MPDNLAVGQRVRIRDVDGCRQDWGEDRGRLGHSDGLSYQTGTIDEVKGPDDPYYPHHPYRVALDFPHQTVWGIARAAYLAADELEVLP
jgi:hypothetical protein